jgi:serine/threonine-protein kinase
VPPIVAGGVVSAVLQGLHAAHQAIDDFGASLHLVHRDVSPQNVLVGADGVVRLLDFGIAKTIGLQTTRKGKLKGKLSYMAPEQLRNEPVSPRTDVYGAAVILWELLTGRRLFQSENEAETVNKVLKAAVPPPSSIVSGLPMALDGVVIRGLQRDPGSRFANARGMAAELDACLGVPSAVEIAQWVERTASAELRDRAAQVAAVERSAAQTTDPPSRPDVGWWVDISTVVAHPDGVSARSSPAGEPDERSRVRAWVAASCLPVLSLALAVALVLAASPRRAIVLRNAVGEAHASPLPPVVQKSSDAADLSVEDLPVPSASSSASPSVVNARRKIVTSPPVGSQWVATPANASHGPNCAPPYTTDAKGHLHFKPGCI